MYKLLHYMPKNKLRYSYIWNAIGGFLYAMLSAVLLLGVTRLQGAVEAGIFSVVFTISQNLLIIGNYEVRPYQVTDIKAKGDLSVYFTLRIFTNIFMIVSGILWIIIGGFELKKAILILILCGYRVTDSVGDVVEGYFQQTDRIYLSGILLGIRTVFPMIVFLVVLVCSKDLVYSSSWMAGCSLLCLILFDVRLAQEDKCKWFSSDWKKIHDLLLNCFPLFGSALSYIFLVSLSKFAIDYFMDPAYQTYYSILFMPTFIINLLSEFVFKPHMTEMANMWFAGEVRKMKGLIKKICLCIVIFTVVVILAGCDLGIWGLRVIYGVDDLKLYRMEFVILLLGGGFNALSIFLRYILTVMRKQWTILVAYVIGVIISIVLSYRMTAVWGLMGAASSYTISLFILCMVFIGIVIVDGRKMSRNERDI